MSARRCFRGIRAQIQRRNATPNSDRILRKPTIGKTPLWKRDFAQKHDCLRNDCRGYSGFGHWKNVRNEKAAAQYPRPSRGYKGTKDRPGREECFRRNLLPGRNCARRLFYSIMRGRVVHATETAKSPSSFAQYDGGNGGGSP